MSAERHATVGVDQLIGELIDTYGEATPEQVDEILAHIAAAPFTPVVRSAPREVRGLTYLGRTVQPLDEPLFTHLVKRVLDERQWAEGTTAAEYLDDLRRAARHPGARLALYARRGGHLAAAVSSTDAVLPPHRQGDRPLPSLIVVYSAQRGAVITGYQFSDLSKVSIPEEARWLR